LLLRNLP